MLDPIYLRDKIDFAAERLAVRGYELDVSALHAIEAERKVLQTLTEQLQNKRNTLSKSIGQAKVKGEDTQALMAEVNAINGQLTDAETKLAAIKQRISDIALSIPNLPDAAVPIGQDENDNVEIRRWGTPKTFTFDPKDHVALGEQLGSIDFDAAAKIAGARFVVIYDQLARLQRALIQFMLDTHSYEHGYKEVYVPYLVNRASLIGTGQLPNMEGDQFKIQRDDEGQNFYLIPTAEVPVTNLIRDTILEHQVLPLKWVAYTPCFRSEAGSYGKDTRGMIRQHQFEKVELVQVVTPDNAAAAHEELTQHAETILQKLGLPYRVVILCGGDLGFSSAKTYDLEVWLPGQQRYREISSCSHFGTFQARRLQARWRNPVTRKTEFLHTLNGSGLAVGRTLIAIMENYQDEQGHIHIPEVLWPYMGGIKIIS